MSKLKHIGLIATAVLFFCACKTKEKQPAVDYAQQGYTKAIVRDYQLDGCRFMIFLDETRKLEPDALPEEMKRDSLPVWVKYQSDPRMSICMAGETVKIIDIKKR